MSKGKNHLENCTSLFQLYNGQFLVPWFGDYGVFFWILDFPHRRFTIPFQ